MEEGVQFEGCSLRAAVVPAKPAIGRTVQAGMLLPSHPAASSLPAAQLSVAAAELAGAATALLAVAGVVAYPGRQARGSWRSLLAFAALLAALLSAFWSVGVWRVAVHERAALVRSARTARLASEVSPCLAVCSPGMTHMNTCQYVLGCLLPPCVPIAQPALWRLLWLPVVPPAYVGLMALAAGVMRATDADVERLRRLRYAYKRA